MRPAYFLVALAPAALAEPQPRANNLASDLAHRSAVASIPEYVVGEHLVPIADSFDSTITRRAARHVLQARSEGSLGQTPWIGMAIGLTCTAFAAVMLG
ncbi:hypothetical protein N7532_005144 [Penicillium argentinense]|uniref:Uncharacterized protein n=1 Tax=Penicillium argentinense TaxID=1131581 RepID=A0A9W9K9P0_9EURO|nr:uncharacterized protein N7532_005144 [Penicillium argentinense]KAJ5098143.1 hypothetical protein N7532_005144 [Penicillium argentinense]